MVRFRNKRSHHDYSEAMASTPLSETSLAASASARKRRGAPLPLAAAVAATWAAIVSCGPLVVLMVVVTAGSSMSVSGASRLAVAAWLLAHGVPLEGADRYTLVPLAVSALAAWRVSRAGLHASRAIRGHRGPSLTPAVLAAFAVAVAYALLGAAAAAAVRTSELSVSPMRAATTLGAFGLVAAAYGALRHSRAGRALWARAPVPLTLALRAGVAVAALVLAAGAVAAGAALAVRSGAAAQMLGAYRAGVLGQAGVTAVCLAYLPNVAVWGAAYLLGPGFAVGVDTVVSPTEVVLGPMPALPVLAALPSSPVSGLAPLLLSAPVASALVAGWLLVRRWDAVSAGDTRGTLRLLATAAAAGPVAGFVLSLAALASSGSLGSGRLRSVGVVDWRLGLVAAGLVALGCACGALVARVTRQHAPE